MTKKPKRIERRSTEAAGDSVRSTAEFNPDYDYVRADLRRIGILAGSLLALLFLLSLILD